MISSNKTGNFSGIITGKIDDCNIIYNFPQNSIISTINNYNNFANTRIVKFNCYSCLQNAYWFDNNSTNMYNSIIINKNSVIIFGEIDNVNKTGFFNIINLDKQELIKFNIINIEPHQHYKNVIDITLNITNNNDNNDNYNLQGVISIKLKTRGYYL